MRALAHNFMATDNLKNLRNKKDPYQGLFISDDRRKSI